MSVNAIHRATVDDEKQEDVSFPQKPLKNASQTKSKIIDANLPHNPMDDVEPAPHRTTPIQLSSHPFIRPLQAMFISAFGQDWAIQLSHKTVDVDWLQVGLVKLFPSFEAFKDIHSLALSATCLFIYGMIGGLSVGTALSRPSLFRGCFYIASMCAWAFHEWIVTVLNHPDWKPDSRNFLIWYKGARYLRMLSFIEHIVLSRVIAPRWFSNPLSIMISLLGMGMIIAGRYGRSIAMLNCGSNFQFELRQQRESHNKLVTDGFYRYVRHPSYSCVILFYLGQCLLLQTPIMSTISMLAVLAVCFIRIASEEESLVEMYGDDYRKFQQQTPPILPIVLGGQVGPV